MAIFTGSNGWHLTDAVSVAPGVWKISANAPAMGANDVKGAYGITVCPDKEAYVSSGGFSGASTKWKKVEVATPNAKSLCELFTEYQGGTPASATKPATLPFITSNGTTLTKYEQNGEILEVHGQTGYDSLKTLFKPNSGSVVAPHDYHKTMLFKGAIASDYVHAKYKPFHVDSTIGKLWSAAEEYAGVLPDEDDTDYFALGHYIDLPFSTKIDGNTYVIEDLSVDEKGCLEVKAYRQNVYGDKATDWHWFYKKHEDETLTHGEDAFPGVVWNEDSQTWPSEPTWVSFSKTSNVVRVWKAVQKAVKQCTLVVPVNIETNEEATTVDYKEIASLSGYTQTFVKQVRCFAAYHNMTTKQAATALKISSSGLPDKDSPKPNEFKGAAWGDLREKALASTHLMGNSGVCLICASEAEKNQGVIPAKVKQFIAFSNDEGMGATKADTDEAKVIRNQVSAFAHYHNLNRYEAVEKIKTIGEAANVLMPFLLPAEKDAPKPDYYKLKTHEWPDLAVVLHYSGKWTCTCDYCYASKTKYQKWYSKGVNHNHLSVEDIKALLPESQEKSLKGLLLPDAPTMVNNNPVQTEGPKDVLCLLDQQEFNVQLAAFAGAHGINRFYSYQFLPKSWKDHYVRSYSVAGLPVSMDMHYEPNEGSYTHYGQIALATACKCNYCKATIKKTPTKTKKALAKKKVSKKSVLANEATIAQAMGEGLTEMPSLTNMPLDKQVLAYCAYHEEEPYHIWIDMGCYGGSQNPFEDDGNIPSMDDLEYHIWPDLSSCGCSECKNQPKNPESKPVDLFGDYAKGGFTMQGDMNKMPAVLAPGYVISPSMKKGWAKDMLSAMNTATETMKGFQNATKVAMEAGEQIVVSLPNSGTVTMPEDAIYTVIPGTAIKMSS